MGIVVLSLLLIFELVDVRNKLLFLHINRIVSVIRTFSGHALGLIGLVFVFQRSEEV